MTQMDAGLRHRLRRAGRQIAKQHAQLRSLHQTLEDAVASHDVDAVCDAVDQFGVAIEAHFSMESGIFFSALHGLYPDAGSELASFVREHEGFLETLAGLREGIADDTLASFGAAYTALMGTIVAHEEREERLVEAVMKEVDPL